MTTKDLTYISLFAALYAVLGFFPPIFLPFFLGLPITAQSMGPMLAGSILGAKRGAAASALFLFLVAIGLPLLAGGRGGIGVFWGPGGGYMIGYPFAAFFIGLMVKLFWRRLNFIKLVIINSIGGIGVVYLFGISWIVYISKIPLWTALTMSLGFMVGDFFKVLIASFIALTVKKSVPLITPSKK
ncbi:MULTISPECIES: biotin transporter BioY [unclassified Bartonella]|uniref:biotin transporter BioY n=1 Tax=unclassified Bartonella TaxID=2645622 RepID=UPI00099958D1|nr:MULTISPECIES: biotin transporter BioY [unclassified Bartonella]AQX17937.1 biotin transport system substrate-specific component [Bartonella sp. A1379B]AQX22450.1 biotin transport system substrate-specific component [Bartonella sp. 11B]AQX24269.1 biotin transport system substrate-specific component [Bartonella sp. 114]AQX24898.1 biotin transport system substrate-specific component [Bartonella sp. Coyote22sub2]